jgi:hypothetical protein
MNEPHALAATLSGRSAADFWLPGVDGPLSPTTGVFLATSANHVHLLDAAEKSEAEASRS